MIITPKYGRLGNRLILAANVICHVAKYGGTYLQLGFEEYAKLYPATAQTGKLLFKSSKQRHWRPRLPFDYLDTSYLTSLPSLIEGYGPYMDMSGKRFRAVEERTHILFARGWSFRDKIALLEFSDVARSFFTPVPDVVDTATSLTKRISDNFRRPLVGVHIRQTDYATFRNGEFFFSGSTYRQCMESTARLLKKEPVFVIASDAAIDEKDFEGLEWYPGPNHITADNLVLSKCDYIIGAPSTYSGWASFYGDKPLFQIRAATPPKSLNDFSVYSLA